MSPHREMVIHEERPLAQQIIELQSSRALEREREHTETIAMTYLSCEKQLRTHASQSNAREARLLIPLGFDRSDLKTICRLLERQGFKARLTFLTWLVGYSGTKFDSNDQRDYDIIVKW